uniref:Uncharacterized protein n=1 Tax=Arundo donax TaxID=35708 RepID=A0A0A8ZTL4_ARUDO
MESILFPRKKRKWAFIHTCKMVGIEMGVE